LHSGHVLRTSSERRKSLLPSRREIRNRHFPFLQIINSSTPSLPRTDRSGATREAGAARNLVSVLELPILFPTMKFTPVTRVQPRKLRLWPAPVIIGIARALRLLYRHHFMEPHAGSLQYRKLHTANHVTVRLFQSLRHALLAHADLASSSFSRTTLESIPRMQPGLNGTGLRAISSGLEYYRRSQAAIS